MALLRDLFKHWNVLWRESETFNCRLVEFLFEYCSTTHATTNAPPSELFFKRRVRTRFDLMRPSTKKYVTSKQTEQKLYIMTNVWSFDPWFLVSGWFSKTLVGQTNEFQVPALRNSVQKPTYHVEVARGQSLKHTLIRWNLLKIVTKLLVPRMLPKQMPLYLIVSSILQLTNCLHFKTCQSFHRVLQNANLCWHPRICQSLHRRLHGAALRSSVDHPIYRSMVVSEHWALYLLVWEETRYLSVLFVYDLECFVYSKWY